MSVAASISPVDKFVTLGVGHETFAIGVDAVQEILDLRPMAALPNAPSFMLGIIDVRGRAVPVIGLREKLGLPAGAASEHTRIVVAEIPVSGRVLTLGLVADRVFEVTALDDSGVESPPEIGVRWRSDYIRAIGRRSGQFVIVFDLGRLFTGEEAALLAQEPTGR